ncbi:MAG TPA: hypothetical protein PLZ21_03220 [Armatimonadota bacterium]|nr:hypothetical protein [Armatimonadota bacterium]
MLKYVMAAIVAVAILAGSFAVVSYAQNPTNQTAWGYPSRGIAISAWPEQSQFKIGDQVNVVVAMKNVTNEKIRFQTVGRAYNNYRLDLYDEAGNPVPLLDIAENYVPFQSVVTPATSVMAPTTTGENGDKAIDSSSLKLESALPGGATIHPDAVRKTVEIEPGKVSTEEDVICLNDWFKIEEPGTYTLIVMRRIRSWDGFPISNAVKIHIIN